jgi:hypothetical protein
MNRRMTRGLAVLGCLVAVSATTVTVVVKSSMDSSAAAAQAAGGTGVPAPDVLRYWGDTKRAISPLLLYVRQLPSEISTVQNNGNRISATQAHQARGMAESFATARDLVGRIEPPASAPAGLAELLQVACQLYRESAFTLTELSVAPRASSGAAVVRRAASLEAIGDRLFDQVRRVLAIDAIGAEQTPVEYHYAPPVPALTTLTGSATPASSDGRDLDEQLRSAGVLIARASTGGAAVTPATTWRELQQIARDLEGARTPSSEDVIAVRLAVALAILAEDAPVHGGHGSADELLMLSNDIWNQARSLSTAPHPAVSRLAVPRTSRAQVWTGGAFGGRPPALIPGQDLASGLPGGLPPIDPAAILGGR